jgi:MSHA biogenesis protein MshL
LRPLLIPPLRLRCCQPCLAACSSIQPQPPSAGHIRAEAQAAPNPNIPAPVAATVTLARPKAAAKAESYSVSVRNIPVQDLLFALARDAKLNIDMHPGINGIVTINAIDQTLQQILTRIAKQVDMRWELDGPNLVVMPDSPFLRNLQGRLRQYVARRERHRLDQHPDRVDQHQRRGRRPRGRRQQFQHLGQELGPKQLLAVAGQESQGHPARKRQDPARRLERNRNRALGPAGHDRHRRTAAPVGPVGPRGQQPGRQPESGSLQQQGTTVVKRTTFREAASIIVNPEAGVVVVRATSRQTWQSG